MLNLSGHAIRRTKHKGPPMPRVPPWDTDDLLRNELFSAERLEQHAASLAAAQQVTKKPIRRPSLRARLRDNATALLVHYRETAVAVRDGRSITPAAEWLLDNYHIIEAQIQEINEDLPQGYYRQLPKLASGPLAGYPRILGIAWAFVAHTDSHFDAESLRRFVRAYQEVEPLTIGENWGVAITLRIVLIENLRRAAARIASGRAERRSADRVADRLLGINGPAEPHILRDTYGDGKPFAPAFVVQLVQRLRDQDPEVTPALTFLKRQVAAQGTTAEAMVQQEHHRQGGSNVTVRNIITSMRLISDTDWAEFFESVSPVDEILRTGDKFASMDFATRNLYRSAIEELARGSVLDEMNIARAAIKAARLGSSHSERRGDPGYHLVAGGRLAFEESIRYRPPLAWRPRRLIMRFGASAYIGAITIVALLILMIALHAIEPVISTRLKILIFGTLGIIPAIDAAVAFVNRAVARGIGATILPGMALRDGIPAELRTLVGMPTLLTAVTVVEAQVERLEIHYLASPHAELYFALLSDWSDASDEMTPADSALLQAAARGIERLNAKYPRGPAGDRFLLLHRRRTWCEVQRCWMGWERKRGKLHELNRLLRGATDTTYQGSDGGAPNVPAGVRFVITLDADTRLPRETARRLIGKLAHPLNRPRFDPAFGRIVEGYAVMQPRVSPSLPIGTEGSLYQRLVSSASGLDPYAAAVSDVYQDLFGEGSYTGKGIYDIDAFEAALDGRAEDGTLLSHDLFEGIFARAGLASDIEVIEEFPARYDVAAARQHRWARGDWQLLPWLFGRGHAGAGAPGRSKLPLIGRWKIADNLRRTLSAPASFAALVLGWILPAHAAVLWTVFILATNAVPTLMPVAAQIMPRRAGIAPLSHLRALSADLWLSLRQIALQIILLPHQAALMVDAVARTLYRLTISHRNLLEWVTAAKSTQSDRLDLTAAYRRMGGSILLAFGAVLLLDREGHADWRLAAPFMAAWLICPIIAVWISRITPIPGRLSLKPADAEDLRSIGRHTWRYFETFVTPEHHGLPPDNFQEDPRPVIAHRTSPTNIGLYLLSTIAAHDFGWIGMVDAVERLEATLATVDGLQRCRGHLYNWYDTHDLRPLEPRYVSSVDSGNLAAHLITLANALHEWVQPPSRPPCDTAGVSDALRLAQKLWWILPTPSGGPGSAFDAQLEAIRTTLLQANGGAAEPAPLLAAVSLELMALIQIAQEGVDSRADGDGESLLYWLHAAARSLDTVRSEMAAPPATAAAFKDRLSALISTALAMANAMDFGFLLDPQRRLLSIGFRVAEGTLDPSCYDLLASEARLASFFAIAKDDVPSRHWHRLGRPVTGVGRGAALLSWSGSMFEYLMPSLVMRAPRGSLLDETSILIVRRQMSHAAALDVPWGISESAYNARDVDLTYQYSNFGVPGLGLKRGLSANLVIAPYATALAAMVRPTDAASNMQRLASLHALGRYGFFEAIDYTPARLPKGEQFVIVRAFMAHHQGMSILAIGNVLMDGIMRTRFHREPCIQATELLLQERTPRDVSVAHPRAEEVPTAPPDNGTWLPIGRRLSSPYEATPQVNLLSNGRYAVMLTAAGSGYSRWRDVAVNRWREDGTRDDTGSYIFLRDADSQRIWSAGYQPSAAEPERYEVTFTEDRAEFTRHDTNITTILTIMVSPESDAEVRHLAITNNSNRARIIEVTSYLELALAPPAADAAHPAFSKMFVQTEYVAPLGALLATRRRRQSDELEIWVAHQSVVDGMFSADAEYETDRARFIGRGRELCVSPAAMDGKRLSNTVGTVLDPIFSLRHRIRVPEGATARISFWTSAASTREGLLELVDKLRDSNAFVRAGTLSWTQAQVQLLHLGITAAEASLFHRLAGHLLFANASLRPSSEAIKRGASAPAALWSQGISGDLPIVLLRIDDIDHTGIARQLLQAHEYWRMKQLAVDLVILNERESSYVQDLQSALEAIVRMSQSRRQIPSDVARGNVFVLRADLITAETRAALGAIARVVLYGRRGELTEQLERPRAPMPPVARQISRAASGRSKPVADPAANDLEFFNGIGGFAADGREYVILLRPGESTPAPWINVIANANFGFHVAAEGSGYTWSVNSRERALTPWSNDPVTNRPGEAFYLMDEDNGDLWGPTAAPVYAPSEGHTVRHGQGYSRFGNDSHGIHVDLLQFVALQDPIKISRLSVRNVSDRHRRLSLTAYVEWVLGVSREASAPYIITELDLLTGAVLARNPWNATFGSRVAFADLGGLQTDWTADRREFLGRHGTLDRPAALQRGAVLARRSGAGLDPCAAMQTRFELAPGATAEIVFFLGETTDSNSARALIGIYRSADLEAELQRVIAHWDDVLGTVHIRTPDRSMDLLMNRWLLYQTLSCRMWARSAFYQASGAYGFRDQLQDSMALCIARPALVRQHLLRAAGRQFGEGDVQHWWLPVTGQGVRTRITDDRIWLAYTVAHYLAVTGDDAILSELVPFIDGQGLRPEETDAFFQPSIADQSVSLYEHCAFALDCSLAVGEHGLPLMGTGDWNDGMNRVGHLGRGESVWLGWFLYSTLKAFTPFATNRADLKRSDLWLGHMKALQASLDEQGWDGGWYRRGYYDDGNALGSSASDECRIDAIAQSWSVISGAGSAPRPQTAMDAVDRNLILRDSHLALLFTPPFDHAAQDPGYVKSYPPGLRENGGQYTHGAVWSIIAFAQLGQAEKAAELFALLNPINRATTMPDIERYKVEPYVVAADIYSVAPHIGRGGWTWYTGSAAWLYRAGLESILGFALRADKLTMNPVIPAHWPGFEIIFHYLSSYYEIKVENTRKSTDAPASPERSPEIELDGQKLPAGAPYITLVDDGHRHLLRVTIYVR
jgi:cyclic beta-1,2-glucan synthetase